MNEGISFALVGCGTVASRHATQIARFGKMIACCDVDESKAIAFAKMYGGNAFGSLPEMLAKEKGIEVVCICTPNGLHAEQAIISLNAGHHVLVEKPMAIRTEDCTKMIEASEKNGKLLFVVKQNRFNPPVVAVKSLIDDGRLGKILSVQVNGFWNRSATYYQSPWRATKAMSGGTLFAQFSHFIDLMYWYLGDVSEVSSSVSNYLHPEIEFEDTCIANIRFMSGAVATLHFTINSFSKNMEGSITIFAEKGTVKIGGQYLNELEYQKIDGEAIPTLITGNPANHYGDYQGSMSNHDKVYENLVQVLGGKGVIATNGREGLKTVEIIEKIYNTATKS